MASSSSASAIQPNVSSSSINTLAPSTLNLVTRLNNRSLGLRYIPFPFLPEFDPATVDQNVLKQMTLTKMVRILTEHWLTLSFNAESKELSVLFSYTRSAEDIQEIFNKKNFVWFKPRVLGQLDLKRNHLLTLVPCDGPPTDAQGDFTFL